MATKHNAIDLAKNGKFPWNEPYIYRDIDLTWEFIDNYFCHINWWYLLDIEKIDDEFIRLNDHRIDWITVAAKVKLTEEQIEEFFHDRPQSHYWHYISDRQILSEKFIRTYSDRLNWQLLVAKQNLSTWFIARNMDKIQPEWLWTRPELDKTFIERMYKKRAEILSENLNLPVEPKKHGRPKKN
jgi:hypothetical protein